MRCREVISKTILHELFGPKQVVGHSYGDGKIKAYNFSVDGVDFSVSMLFDGESWEISFKETDSYDFESNGKQGTKSVQVFAHVVQAIREFIESEKPQRFHFSANEADNKLDLYRAMVKTLSRLPIMSGYRSSCYHDYASSWLFEFWLPRKRA